MTVTIDLPNREKVRKELQLLDHNESPSPDDLSPALFKVGNVLLMRELSRFFEKV